MAPTRSVNACVNIAPAYREKNTPRPIRADPRHTRARPPTSDANSDSASASGCRSGFPSGSGSVPASIPASGCRSMSMSMSSSSSSGVRSDGSTGAGCSRNARATVVSATPSRRPMTTSETCSARQRHAWATCPPVNLVGRPISRTSPADP